MRHTKLGLTMTALAVGAIVSVPSQQALARESGASVQASSRSETFFVLTRTDAQNSTKATTLRCDPSGGTHPNAQKVCDQLLSTDGALELPASDTMCPLIHSPVRVTATGYWRHHAERFRQIYSNSCVLSARTGSVFQF